MSSFPVLPRPGQKYGSDPSMSTYTDDIVRRWPTMTDEEKLQYIDQYMEMAGGTAGAMLGSGVASIPAAGLGALVANKAGRLGANLAGLKEKPTTVGEGVIDAGKTFAWNAGGEAFGRALPLAFNALPKAVKQLPLRVLGAPASMIDAVQPSNVAGLVRNKWRSMFPQTPEGKILEGLAAKHGVTDLDYGQASGQPTIQMLGLTLARSPFGTKQISKSHQAQYKQYEQSLQNLLDSYHQGSVSLEDFARMADSTMANAKQAFNTRVSTSAASAGKQLNPTTVSNVEAGVGLKAGAEANEQAVRDWASKAYGDIDSKYGDVQIDITPLGRKSMEIMRGLPLDQLEGIFPPKAIKLLKSTRVIPSSEEVPLVERMYAEMNNLPTPMGQKTPPLINLRQAREARSELLERAAALKGDEAAKYRRQVYQLADAVDRSMEEALAATPGAEKVYGKLKSVNDQYRQFMERLRAPRSPGKPGSTAAPLILGENIPEYLPAQVTASPTMTQQTVAAVKPGMAGSTNAVDPTQLLRRNRFDSIVDKATVVDPATGYSRISPTRFADALPERGTAEALFGPQLPDVAGIGKPKLVKREQLLYNSPLAKERGSANAVFQAAFPERSFGGNVDETLQLFREAGNLPQAQRAYGQQLLSKSETPMKSIGDSRYTNPRNLEVTLERQGETVPRVLGQDAPDKLKELVDLGKGLTESEFLFGNPSGTARMVQHINMLNDVITPANLVKPWNHIGKVVAHGKAFAFGADRFTDPSKYSTLLDPPEKILGLGAYSGGGHAGRMAAQLPPKAEPETPNMFDSTEEVPDFFAKENEDVPDFFVKETQPKRKPNVP